MTRALELTKCVVFTSLKSRGFWPWLVVLVVVLVLVRLLVLLLRVVQKAAGRSVACSPR